MNVLSPNSREQYRPANRTPYPSHPDDPEGVTSFWGKLLSINQIDEEIAYACKVISFSEELAMKDHALHGAGTTEQLLQHKFILKYLLTINELLLHRQWVIQHLLKKRATKLYRIIAASPENNRMFEILGEDLVMHIARVTTFTKYGPPAVCR